MALTDKALERRARRAYEVGRLRHAASRAWLPIPLVLLADVVACRPSTTLGVGIALLATTLFLAWRGQHYERAIVPATLAGLLTFAAPIGCRELGVFGSPLLVICFAGGVIAGGGLGWWTARRGQRAIGCLVAGGLHATLVGALGCATLGAGALVGMAAGLIIASGPVYFAMPARG